MKLPCKDGSKQQGKTGDSGHQQKQKKDVGSADLPVMEAKFIESPDLIRGAAYHQLEAKEEYQEGQADNNGCNDHQEDDNKFEDDIHSAAF